MIDEERERSVVAELQAMRGKRDNGRAEAAIAALEIAAAWGEANLPDLILDCVEAYCTIGEICRSLETVLREEG
jgi:methylmalonyl-CoA mutase N-terminal domain/subunit